MTKDGEPEQSDLPEGLLSETGLDRLHIGGTVRKPGWRVLNALPGDHVDHLGDVRDLSMFESASFDLVYASHVLEHVSYREELPSVLESVARILRPGGRLFVSVPDLRTLCRIFDHPEATEEIRFAVMRMMFGGQMDAYDFHQVGLWDGYLANLLFGAGFREVYRVPLFGIFEDTSNLRLGNTLISLNMVAVK